jgi:hypothetical protein
VWKTGENERKDKTGEEDETKAMERRKGRKEKEGEEDMEVCEASPSEIIAGNR